MNEQNMKTECPNIDNYIGIIQVINLMHEWLVSYDFRFLGCCCRRILWRMGSI